MVQERKYLVRWQEYSVTIQSAMQNFRLDEELLDCTLACDGFTVRAHKLVLAASSLYFRQVFKDYPCKHPTIILEGIKMRELLNILHFMYSGKILLDENEVAPLLLGAAYLLVDGLSYVTAALSKEENDSKTSNAASPLNVNVDLAEENTADIPSDENTRSEEGENRCSEIKTSNNINPLCSNVPSQKRIRNVPENLPIEGDFFKKSCSENNSKTQLSPKSPENSNAISDNDCFKNEDYDKEGAISLPSVLSSLSNGHAENGEKSYHHNEEEANSPENGDFDCGPPPLPPNHPAVIAAAYSAAVGGTPSGLNYAALVAAGVRSQLLPSPYSNGSCPPAGAANLLPLPGWFLKDPSSPTPVSAKQEYIHPSGHSVQEMQSTFASNNGNRPPGGPANPPLPGWLQTDRNSPTPMSAKQEYIHPIGHSVQEMQATLEQYQRKLAFHEPRPCPTCKRMYRDAATLRTHIAIMHFEGQEPYSCSCGSLFRSKYDMYKHKKNGHR